MTSSRRFSLRALAAATLLATAAVPAAAFTLATPVTYTFTAFSSFDFEGEMISGAFTVTLPDFVTSDTVVPVDSLTSCTVVSSIGDAGICREQTFLMDISPGAVTVSFGISTPLNPGTGVYYYFDDSAFSTIGTHESTIFGTDQAGRLVVSTVPEPATWASMALGISGLMLLARRRRAR